MILIILGFIISFVLGAISYQLFLKRRYEIKLNKEIDEIFEERF